MNKSPKSFNPEIPVRFDAGRLLSEREKKMELLRGKILGQTKTRHVKYRPKAVVLLWFSVACFGVRVSVTFRLACVHIISVRFGLLSGHILGNSCSIG